MNTLIPIFPKKMDLRVITGVCQRLTCRTSNKTNYYFTLFTAAEQDAICKTALHCKDKARVEVEWPIIAHYFDSIKRSPLIGSLVVSNKVRQYLYHRDYSTQNIFSAPIESKESDEDDGK